MQRNQRVRPLYKYMKTHVLAIVVVLFGFTSCMKKDEPMELPEQGDAVHESLSLGADYSTQYYYNLREQKIVHSSKVSSWDLAFENSKDGIGVYLNGGDGLALVETKKTDFSDITRYDCDDEQWFQDDPNGDAKESAIGDWNKDQTSRDKIYIIRLNSSNTETRTLKLHKVTDDYYEFEVGKIGSNQTTSCKIYKDPTRVYSYYDLEKMETVLDVEPIKESWDILFTRYGFTFYEEDPPLPYIVTGVLGNPMTTAFKDSTSSFYDIGSEIIGQGTLSSDRDVIGYDWKRYDFDLGLYHIHQEYNYIIKTQNEEYFKLRFLSFYDQNGVKGSPSFEFKRIH